MLLAGLLASVEHGLNRVLRMDSTALPRLAALEGKVIEIDCRNRPCRCSSCPMKKA
jgi:ubiquinone biosynthesis protein UbiJ